MTNLTKDLIKKTFLSLLEKKPLSQITVKMIVEECGINRNSFYYHYQDLPALIEEMVCEEADRIMREYPTIDSIDTALGAVVEFASMNRRAILHIYNSVNRDIFERYLWKVCRYAVTTYGEMALKETGADPSDREIIAHFYICECFGIVINWLEDKMETDMQTMISRICKLHRGMAEEMFRRSAEE